MTWRWKYIENYRLIRNYVAYLDECTSFHKRIRLCQEIARLQNQNEDILKMSVEEVVLSSGQTTMEVVAVFSKEKSVANDKSTCHNVV